MRVRVSPPMSFDGSKPYLLYAFLDAMKIHFKAHREDIDTEASLFKVGSYLQGEVRKWFTLRAESFHTLLQGIRRRNPQEVWVVERP